MSWDSIREWTSDKNSSIYVSQSNGSIHIDRRNEGLWQTGSKFNVYNDLVLQRLARMTGHAVKLEIKQGNQLQVYYVRKKDLEKFLISNQVYNYYGQIIQMNDDVRLVYNRYYLTTRVFEDQSHRWALYVNEHDTLLPYSPTQLGSRGNI